MKTRNLQITTLVVCAVVTMESFAAWKVIPSASNDLEYQTNVAFSARNASDEGGFSNRISGQLDLSYLSERTTVNLRPIASYIFYEKDLFDDLETDEYLLTGLVQHRTERSEFGMSGRVSLRNAFRGEFDPAIERDPENARPEGSAETGILNDEQTVWRVSPYWTYALSRTDELATRLRYQDVEYDSDGFDSGRFDYDRLEGSLEWSKRIGPRHSFFLQGLVGRFESREPNSNTTNETDSYGFVAGYSWSASERDTINATIGITETDVELDGPLVCTDPQDIANGLSCREDDSATNVTGSVEWRRQTETVEYRLRYRRAVFPTSQGAERLRNEVRLFANRRFAPRLSGRIGVIGYLQEDVADGGGSKRNYVSPEVEVTWQFARRFSLSGAYRYVRRDLRDEDLFGDSGTTNDNVFRITLAWEGAPFDN